MYKLAQLKEAEVRGAIAALIDNGVLPVDSQMQFEKVAAETADMLGYNYDLSDLADAASYALNKVAAVEDAQLSLGQLALQKVAGDIDGDMFDYYATAIVKEAAAKAGKGSKKTTALGELWNATKRVGGEGWKGLKNAWTAKELRQGLGIGTKSNKINWGKTGKGALKTLGAYGVPAAALYGGYKYLND